MTCDNKVVSAGELRKEEFMKKRGLRSLLVLLVLAMVFVFSCGEKSSGGGSGDDIVELTITVLPTYELGVMKQLENPDNVIVPYIEERFGLRVKEIMKVPPDMVYPQAIAMWTAAGMAPDLMQCGAEDFGAMVSSGAFTPLDSYLENMPNYEKYLPREYWSREVGEDGKVYAFYNQPGHAWPQPEPAADDVVTMSMNHRALWVREDVLDAIGYSYTPVMELKKETIDKGIRPTAEQLAISPSINTPEDFLEFLRKIKAANLKAIDGSDVIPMSLVSWETWHLGVMFDWGYWRINEAGEVDGYLGLPGTRDYMEWLWTAYQEGLIDPDYLVHKSVQLQEKIATAKVAVGEYVPDALGTFAQLEQNKPEAIRHFIPFPKQSPDYGFYDTYTPHSYHRTLINKDLPEDVRLRIAEFVDWLYTDEAMEIMAWGPEDAGLYEVVDGKRRFVDPQVEEDILSGATEGEGVYKWGLYDSVIDSPSDPLANALGPRKIYPSVFHEYGQTGNYMALISSIVGSEPSNLPLGTKLQVANSDQSEVVQGVADWYWGIFPQTYLPQLLKAEDEAQFEERYAQMMDAFYRETSYEQAKANMVEYFKQYPPMY